MKVAASWMNTSTTAAACKEGKEELFLLMHTAINLNRDDWLESVVNWTSSNKLTEDDLMEFLIIRLEGVFSPSSRGIPMSHLPGKFIKILTDGIYSESAYHKVWKH